MRFPTATAVAAAVTMSLGALAASGCGDDSSGTTPLGPAEDVVDTTPPAVPTGFTVDGNPHTGIAVRWQHNSEADLLGYAVQRSLDQGASWHFAVGQAVTNATFVDSYHARAEYRVAALDASGNQSAYSAPARYEFVDGGGGGKDPSKPIEP